MILKVSGCLLAALVLAVPVAADAAGLGRLVVLSTLGQPFRAEIDLLSYRDEWAAIQPRLASPDTYKLADFRYSPALDGARLTIKKQINGRNYIEVSSTQPVNEPFIYLVVELDRNGARVMRSYTALLDPPGYGAGPPRTATVQDFQPAALFVTVPVSAVSTAMAAPRPPRPQAVAAPAVIAAAGNSIDAAQLQRMEDMLSVSTKTLAAMLARVAVMEEQVKQLQRMLEVQRAPAAAAPKAPSPAAPPVVQTSPPVQPAMAQPPRSTDVQSAPSVPRRGKSYFNEALLVFGVGCLIMLGWLAYLMWGRKPKRRE